MFHFLPLNFIGTVAYTGTHSHIILSLDKTVDGRMTSFTEMQMLFAILLAPSAVGMKELSTCTMLAQ